jgi:hypothetical protein
MKITVLALSTVLLCSTGAFAQANAPATSSDNGSSMSSTQPADTNGGGMQSAAPSTNTQPMNDHYGHHRGRSWGWIGLFGLLGLLGMGKKNRNDVVATTTTRPR